MAKPQPEFTFLEGIALASAAMVVLKEVPDDCPPALQAISVAPLITALQKLDDWLETDLLKGTGIRDAH